MKTERKDKKRDRCSKERERERERAVESEPQIEKMRDNSGR